MQHHQPRLVNLNHACIAVENEGPIQPLSDFSVSSDDGTVAVYFRGLEEQLISYIRKAQMVVGCVAWLTSKPVLYELAKVKHGVAIVVQKEDFLRPDLDSSDNWRTELRQRYELLVDVLKYHQWNGLMDELCSVQVAYIDPVRCVGNSNRERTPAFPRMHNKFLLFCDVDVIKADDYGEQTKVRPYAVWTGSFNLTKNATASLENAVVLKDPRIVQAYFNEWQQIEAIAEPLDWDSVWCEPEWRIGS